MTLKPGMLGLLTFAALAAAVVAAAAKVLGLRRLGEAFFAASFAAAGCAIGLRWTQMGQPPLKDLFEVFLWMSVTVYPLSLFCRLVLRTDSPAGDALIAAVVLVPATFIFSAQDYSLPPALQSPLFVPHVVSYLLSYIIVTMAAVAAGRTLVESIRGQVDHIHERATFALVTLAMPLMTLGLALGAVWGKLAWGDWWNWDPKELWSLASWLVLVVYLHSRRAWPQRRILNSSLVLIGAIFVAITLLWVNLGRIFQGLHSYAT